MERDFTGAKINRFRMYGGNNGNKISIMYEGENYMLKFPPKPSRNPEMSYTNGCVSEYVACHVFETLGIDTQKTLLGTYGDKVTVACRDFAVEGYELKDFASLKNTVIESSSNGYGTDLQEVLSTIREQQMLSPKKLEQFFWEMFVGDSLLGNFDRHNGNWGFLVNEGAGEIKIAPIYDCGSCLYPQLGEKNMEKVLSSQKEIDERIYVFPNSALKQNDRKINYCQFLTTTEIPECISAIKKIGSRVDLAKINAVIDSTPYITELHREFLKTMIKERKEKIIDKALGRLVQRERPIDSMEGYMAEIAKERVTKGKSAPEMSQHNRTADEKSDR